VACEYAAHKYNNLHRHRKLVINTAVIFPDEGSDPITSSDKGEVVGSGVLLPEFDVV